MPCNMAATKKEKQQMGRGGNMVEEFYLLDLERTIGMGRPFFGKEAGTAIQIHCGWQGSFQEKKQKKLHNWIWII